MSVPAEQATRVGPAPAEARVYAAHKMARCWEAMPKPGPLEALRLIASGRLVGTLARDGRDVLVESFDGAVVRDPEFPDRKIGFAGSWPLFVAGMIDADCRVTQAGRAFLAAQDRVVARLTISTEGER